MSLPNKSPEIRLHFVESIIWRWDSLNQSHGLAYTNLEIEAYILASEKLLITIISVKRIALFIKLKRFSVYD